MKHGKHHRPWRQSFLRASLVALGVNSESAGKTRFVLTPLGPIWLNNVEFCVQNHS